MIKICRLWYWYCKLWSIFSFYKTIKGTLFANTQNMAFNNSFNFMLWCKRQETKRYLIVKPLHEKTINDFVNYPNMDESKQEYENDIFNLLDVNFNQVV